MIKVKKTILLVSIIVTTPFVALCCLLLFNLVNPMQLAFLTSFKMENQSGKDIWVTPVGTVGEKGRKAQLPIYFTIVPAVPSMKTSRFHLKEGDILKIRYDWDDINFSEIVVESKDGHFYQFIVDPNPTKPYHPPKSRHFIIPSLETLSSVQPTVHESVTQRSRWWVVCYLTYGSVILFFMYWRMITLYRKEKAESIETPSQVIENSP